MFLPDCSRGLFFHWCRTFSQHLQTQDAFLIHQHTLLLTISDGQNVTAGGKKCLFCGVAAACESVLRFLFLYGRYRERPDKGILLSLNNPTVLLELLWGPERKKGSHQKKGLDKTKNTVTRSSFRNRVSTVCYLNFLWRSAPCCIQAERASWSRKEAQRLWLLMVGTCRRSPQ